MIRLIYKGKDSKKIKNEVLKTFNFLYNIFLVKTPDVVVRIHDNRIDFDKQLKTRTADWCIANASYDNKIDILSPFAIENESSHKKSEFLPVLKHEFAHLFIDKLVNGKVVPKWLDEGLAQYIAKQYKDTSHPKEVEDNFCKKLSTPNGWYKRINSYSYQISVLFVYFLIKKYSFKKVKELLFLLEKEYKYSRFKKIFFEVYKINLTEVEKIFIKSIID